MNVWSNEMLTMVINKQKEKIKEQNRNIAFLEKELNSLKYNTNKYLARSDNLNKQLKALESKISKFEEQMLEQELYGQEKDDEV